MACVLPMTVFATVPWHCSGVLLLVIHTGVDPAHFVDSCYTVSKYKMAYGHGIEPLNGPKMWAKMVVYHVKPQRLREMPGRPKKQRKMLETWA
ncbi:hypothetical protein OROGR_031657 [Orobanche gracilis]